MMPKRPRQHQLEDESRNAFRQLLPKQWVFRDSVPDYGIDGEVEIFDERGMATSLMFKVQLKATDKTDLKQALTIRLPLQVDKYYRSLDLPTLIVRYHAQTGVCYSRWFHTFDPYYYKDGKKTFTIHLRAEDKWDEKRPCTILDELRLFRGINSGNLPLPVRFTLIMKRDVVHGVPAVQLASRFRKLAEEISGIIEFTTDTPPHAHPRIEIDNDKALVDLAGMKTATYHTRNKYPKAQAIATFHFDVMLFVAVVLYRAGHPQIAAQIVTQFADRSDVIRNPRLATELTKCLVSARKFSEALRLSDKILDVNGDWVASQIISFAPYVGNENMSKCETDELIEFLERRVQRAETSSNSLVAAASHYNLGQPLRGISPRRAFHHYRKAIEYDPGYSEREYFWRELGAMFFNSSRFGLAARFYKQAIQKGAAHAHHVLYADALMFAGEYLESQNAFEAYNTGEGDTQDTWAPEWRLKILLLREIRSRLCIDRQDRRPNAAAKQLPQSVESFSDEMKPAIEAALKLDALSWKAWADLARVDMSAKRLQEAFVPFLAIALIQRTECQSWCWAILTSQVYSPDQSLATDIVTTAYLINGETFVEEVRAFVQKFPDELPKEDFLNEIDQIVSRVKRWSPRSTIRVVGKGAQYQVIHPRPSTISN